MLWLLTLSPCEHSFASVGCLSVTCRNKNSGLKAQLENNPEIYEIRQTMQPVRLVKAAANKRGKTRHDMESLV